MNAGFRLHVALAAICGCLLLTTSAHAELLGYWSGDTNGGAGSTINNDQGNAALNGALVPGAAWTANAGGHTGLAGDYAVDLPGLDADHVTVPGTGVTFSEITITGWINGQQTGGWTGLIQSRDDDQPIGIGYRGTSGQLTYTWNNNSDATYNFNSGLDIPTDGWAFVALTVTPSQARLYVGTTGAGASLSSATNTIAHMAQGNPTDWRFGEDNCCGTARNLAGLIDDVAIWDHALSDEEIASLWDGSQTPLGPAIPEPSTLLLAALGLLGLGFTRRRRRR